MSYKHETVKPYNEQESKSSQIRRMFDNIAPEYDRLNHLLSLTIDKIWRKRAISCVKQYAPAHILDVATGTGDFALMLSKALPKADIIGCDISDGMMQVARDKCKRAGATNVKFEQEDCTALTYAPASFDAVTISFGIRNFDNLEKSLAECHRVLSNNGHLVIIELSTPTRFPMKQLFPIYSASIMPLMGRLLTKDRKAYNYLPASIDAFPQGEVMQKALEEAGFTDVIFKRMTGGICTMYIATKKS